MIFVYYCGEFYIKRWYKSELKYVVIRFKINVV